MLNVPFSCYAPKDLLDDFKIIGCYRYNLRTAPESALYELHPNTMQFYPYNLVIGLSQTTVLDIIYSVALKELVQVAD